MTYAVQLLALVVWFGALFNVLILWLVWEACKKILHDTDEMNRAKVRLDLAVDRWLDGGAQKASTNVERNFDS